MKISYDILKKSDDGSMLWMEAVENLDQAQTRINDLAQRSPGNYCIFDQTSQRMVTTVHSKAAAGIP